VPVTVVCTKINLGWKGLTPIIVPGYSYLGAQLHILFYFINKT